MLIFSIRKCAIDAFLVMTFLRVCGRPSRRKLSRYKRRGRSCMSFGLVGNN